LGGLAKILRSKKETSVNFLCPNFTAFQSKGIVELLDKKGRKKEAD